MEVMTTDRLHAARRRAVLAVAGLVGSPTTGSDLGLGPWYLRVGGRFAGPVARVVSRHPLGLSTSCTLELGAPTAAAMTDLIDGGLSGAGSRADLTLFRGRSTGIVGLELSGARVTALTLPRRDATSAGAPAVQVAIAWQGRTVSRLPDSFVVAAESPAAADGAPLAVRIDGRPVRAEWVGATIPGDLTLAVPEVDLDAVFAPWMSRPGEARPVTVAVGRFALSLDARFRSVRAASADRTVVFALAARRAALRVTPA
jgi:hypothetical protein